MVDSVSFPPSIGGSGKTYTNDANPQTGMFNGGHRINFFPILSDTLAAAGYVSRYAQAIDGAKANADRAENARGYVEAVADAYKVNILEQFKNKATLVSDFTNHDYRLYDGLRTNKVADTDLWTIQRATTGSYVDATRKIRTAAIDEPRYTYNPATGKAGGVLCESNKTNLILYSESLNQGSKTTSGVTVESDYAVAPDGNPTADFLKEDSLDLDAKKVRCLFPAVAGEEYCMSFFVKKGGRQNVMVLLNTDFENRSVINFNLSTGFINKFDQDLSGLLSYDMESYNEGWFRCHVSATALTTTNTARIEILIKDSDNLDVGPYQGDGVSGLILWGIQAEKGRKPSSYIKTTTATVTRSEDSFTKSDVDAQISQNNFSFLASFVPKMNVGVLGTTEVFYKLFEFNDGTLNNRIRGSFRGKSGYSRALYLVITKDGNSDSVGFTTLEYAQEYKLGASFLNDNLNLFINGTQILSTSVPSGIPDNLSQLSLSNGEIIEYKNFILLPSAVTAAELETLTAI